MERLIQKILVGADGVNSRAAKKLGLYKKRNTMTAIEGEVYFKQEETLNRFKTTAHFDFGIISNGYGWVFPKTDHLSIGLLSVSEKTNLSEQHVMRYAKMKGLEGLSEVRLLKGHLIPCCQPGINFVANEKGLLIGDAAGFTDPVTGEGIYYAVKEALIASEVIADALGYGYNRMNEYNTRLNKEFAREILCSRRIARFVYAFPWIRNKLLMTRGNEIGTCHIDIISGAKTYSDLYAEIFTISKLISVLLRVFFKFKRG